MGTLALVGAGSRTPQNSSKDGYYVAFQIRDSVGPTSPVASPFQSGAALVITNAQLQTAAPRGLLRRLFRAGETGEFISPLTAGPTQAQARALLMSRDPSPSVPTVLTSGRVPRATCSIKPLHYRGSGDTKPVNRLWSVDASVDGSSKPTLVVRCTWMRNGVTTATAAASPWNSPCDALLEIRGCHSQTGR